MVKNFSLKQLIIFGILVVIVLGTIGLYFYKNILNREKNNEEEYWENWEENEEQFITGSSIALEDAIEEKIIIHIVGHVNKQGIIILSSGDRIADAIELAGGETEEADLTKINLAYVLQDGDKVYIPGKNDNSEDSYINSGEENYVKKAYNGSESGNGGIININKATKEQLQTLNGIGESMANKIIKYREENGMFASVEDIKNVPGIGDAKFNGIKDRIAVK